MTVFLCIYGSFTWIFASLISHDFAYVDELSATIGYELPEAEYVSVLYDYSATCESMAMIKVSSDKTETFVSELDSNTKWIKASAYMPLEILLLSDKTQTSQYDFFCVYNVTKNKYFTFSRLESIPDSDYSDGQWIYIAYDVESRIISVFSYVE